MIWQADKTGGPSPRTSRSQAADEASREMVLVWWLLPLDEEGMVRGCCRSERPWPSAGRRWNETSGISIARSSAWECADAGGGYCTMASVGRARARVSGCVDHSLGGGGRPGCHRARQGERVRI